MTLLSFIEEHYWSLWWLVLLVFPSGMLRAVITTQVKK